MSTVRVLVGAGVVWLVPFLVSMVFVSPDGSLSVPFWAFKLIMLAVLLVVTTGVTLVLLRRHRGVSPYRAALAGGVAAVVNVLLDVLVLLPVSGYRVFDYAWQVAPMYLLLPGVAAVVARRAARRDGAVTLAAKDLNLTHQR